MEDIPKYRKKSQKKPPKKANHKHEWVNCVYETETVGYSKEKGLYKMPELTIGKYCSICGKIGAVSDLAWRANTSQYSHFFHYEWSEEAKKEFNRETRTLPFFKIDQFKDKFVEQQVEQ